MIAIIRPLFLLFQMECVEKDYVSEKRLAVKDFEVSK